MTRDHTAFGHDTTTDEVLDGIDLDGTAAERLWAISEEMVGQSFSF